jgi:hypothetical protein
LRNLIVFPRKLESEGCVQPGSTTFAYAKNDEEQLMNVKRQFSRPESRRKARIMAAATLAGSMILVATGCAGESGNAAGAAGTDSGVFEWTPGPLDEFQARIWGFSLDGQQETQQEAQARIDQEGREIEENIAACMAALGFEYNMRPDAGGTIIIMGGADDDGPQWGSRNFVETYGFAISTDPWGSRMAVDDVDGPREVWVDPNQELFDNMSESELQAWQEALWGPPWEGDWEDWDWTIHGGCSGQAQGAIWGSRTTPEQFLPLEEEMNNLWSNIQSDPRISALNTEWATCMSTAGYPGFTAANDIQMDLWAEWDIIQGWEARNEVFNSWNWDLNPEGPSEDMLPQPDPAEVAAFTEREIALAIADFNCRAAVDFDAASHQVTLDWQQRFVDQNRGELEAWALHMEALRNG